MSRTENKQLSVVDLIIDIRNAVKYLLSKRLLILMITFAAGAVGVLYGWFQKPRYIAVITFFTEGDMKSGLGMYAGLAAQFGLDLGSSSSGVFEGDNLMEILRSRNLVKKTLLSPVDEGSKMLMIEKYISDNEINKNWSKNPKYKNVSFQNLSLPDRMRDSIIDKVYESIVKNELSIEKRDKKVDLIDVKIKTANEYFAKRFVELLTYNTIKYYTEYKIKKTRQNVEILQRQTDSVKSNLYGNINQVAELGDVNVNPLRQISRTGTQRKQIDLQANGALYGELLKNLELSKLALRKETPLIQIVDEPSIPLKKERTGRLLSGIIFAFLAGFITITFLLTKRWLILNDVIGDKRGRNSNKNMAK